MPSPSFAGRDLELELLDAGRLSLVRLFRPDYNAAGDWEPSEPQYRKLRADPPEGHRDRYAILYTSDTLRCVAAECRILAEVSLQWTWRPDLAEQYHVVRYATQAPALFLPLDGRRNAETLGLGSQLTTFDSYAPYQRVALEVFERYGSILHGFSWASFHRNQPGRVYAIWHHHKTTIDLKITSPRPYSPLADDAEWQAFLGANPNIESAR